MAFCVADSVLSGVGADNIWACAAKFAQDHAADNIDRVVSRCWQVDDWADYLACEPDAANVRAGCTGD